MKFKKNNLFPKQGHKLTIGILLLTAILGGFFRFYNLNWDRGYFFNPDESNNIAHPAAGLKASLHPGNFTYGSFTIYLYRGGAKLMNFLTQDPAWIQADRINVVGRFFSGLFSLSTIFLIFYLGRRLFSPPVGLLAAVLTAFNVGLIQASHFGTTETILTLAGVLIMTAILFLKTRRYQFGYFLAGFVLGLASATKISALVFLPLFFLAHFLFLSQKTFSLLEFRFWIINKKTLIKKNLWLVFSLVLMTVVFFIASPYSFLDYPAFRESFDLQRKIATGEIPVFFTKQFEQTVPWLFQFFHVLPWLCTYPVLILGAAGAVFTLVRGFKRKNLQKIFLVLLPGFYFLATGSLFVKWTRYMIPLVPFICLLAAVSLSETWQRFKKNRLARGLTLSLFSGVLAIQFIYTLAFFRIYRVPDARATASEWIYQNIPPEKNFLLEPLDVVSLPLPTAEHQPSLYRQQWFDFYALGESRGSQRLTMTNELAEKLTETDYIIIGSRRLWANHLRLRDQYPASAQYYLSLFKGDLGFKKIKEFCSPPQIFGLKINDDSAEETFQVFDHPGIIIFEKTQNLTIGQYLKILQDA